MRFQICLDTYFPDVVHPSAATTEDEREGMFSTMYWVIKQAGGRVEIPRRSMFHFDKEKARIETYRDPRTLSTILEVFDE